MASALVAGRRRARGGAARPTTRRSASPRRCRLTLPRRSPERRRLGAPRAGPGSPRSASWSGSGRTAHPVPCKRVQQLVLVGKGDYSFIVPGPLTDVLPGTGTDSQPGFRTDAIVWQGFSPGRRVLAALATLRTRDTAPSLPVRVSLRTTVGGRELRPGERRSGPLVLELAVQNVTPAPIVTFAATGVPIELAGVLDGLRQTIESGTPYMSYVADDPVQAEAAQASLRGASSPSRARSGSLVGGSAGCGSTGGRPIAGRVEFGGRLGEDAPLRLSLRITGRAIDLAPPRLELHVTPDLDLHALRPPLGRTWKEAVRRRLVQIDGREFLGHHDRDPPARRRARASTRCS